MNPLVIETRLVACITPFFPGMLIFRGTDYGVQTPEEINLVIACENISHTCGNLYLADVSLTFTSPPLIGAVALAELNASVASLQDALHDPGFADQWQSSSPFYGGIYIKDIKTAPQGDMWTASVTLTLGISI